VAEEKSLTYDSVSAGETIRLGRNLGCNLQAGDVVALIGELGSGKTWFAKGIGLGLGVPADTVITSPSFSLMNVYEGRYPFYHIDGYRLENLSDFLSAGLDEYLYQDGIAAVEWADRWPEILPDWHVRIEILITGDTSRRICLSGFHPRALEILDAMSLMSRNRVSFEPDR